MHGGEAFGGNFFVGEAVVAEVAVAVGVIPLVALRAASTGADFDDDETEVGEGDVGTFGGERFVDLFGWRAGVDELDERIFAGGIEVERLVHDAVEIGDAVFGFDFEDFGKFEAGFEELGDVGGFEVEELGALGVEENGFWSGVDTGVGVGEKFTVVGRAEGVREIAWTQELEAGAVEIDAVEMRVVRIFAMLAAVGGEIEGAGFFVKGEDLIGDVFAGS